MFKAIPANLARGWDRFCGNACLYVSRRIAPQEQLRRFVDRSAGDDGCWPWMGTRSREGYGVVSVRGKQVKAHRLAWESFHGRPVPEGRLIRHLCEGGGNPWCCNPAHLMPGDALDNARDKVLAGRQCAADRNGRARLTRAQVQEIRERHRAGETARGMAREFGVVHSTIQKIVKGRAWGGVT